MGRKASGLGALSPFDEPPLKLFTGHLSLD